MYFLDHITSRPFNYYGGEIKLVLFLDLGHCLNDSVVPPWSLYPVELFCLSPSPPSTDSS